MRLEDHSSLCLNRQKIQFHFDICFQSGGGGFWIGNPPTDSKCRITDFPVILVNNGLKNRRSIFPIYGPIFEIQIFQ